MAIHEKPGFFRRLIGGKGFYAALGACLIVAAGAGLAGILHRSATPTPPTTSSRSEQHADTPVTDVTDDRTTRATTRAATATTTVRTTAPTTAAAAELYVLPFGNTVIAPFSGDTPVYNTTMGDWRTHNGVDFAGKKGDEIKALADGTVLRVEEDLLWGGVLVIDHGYGLISRYCGIIPYKVEKGTHVKVGQTVATLGSIPCEIDAEPHLHLETVSGDAYVDPLRVIDLPTK